MFTYFYDFISNFTGITNNVVLTVLTELIVVALSITVLYLLVKLPFPRDTIVKRTVFIVLYVVSFILVLYANDITLISITQHLPTGGVV